MSSNTKPFEEVFKHIKNNLPNNTLQTLEQNYNAQDNLSPLFIKNQKDLEAYNLPNTKAQIEQSKLQNDKSNWDKTYKERDIKEIQKLQDYKAKTEKAKTEKVLKINSLVEEYKALGGDISIFQKELDKFYSQNEIGYGEKFKLMFKAQPRAYRNTFNKVIAYLDDKEYKPEYSNEELLEIEKINREKLINPFKTMGMDVLLDPANVVPLSLVTKGGKVVRALKDFGKGGIYTAGTDALKHGGDDNYKFQDSLIAGAFGGVLNAGLGQLLGKSLKNANALNDTNPNKAINQTEDLVNNTNTNTFNPNATDDEIASKIAQNRFKTKY